MLWRIYVTITTLLVNTVEATTTYTVLGAGPCRDANGEVPRNYDMPSAATNASCSDQCKFEVRCQAYTFWSSGDHVGACIIYGEAIFAAPDGWSMNSEYTGSEPTTVQLDSNAMCYKKTEADSGCFSQSAYASLVASDNSCDKQPCTHFSTGDSYLAWCLKMACANTARDAWCVNGGSSACINECSSCTPTQKQCFVEAETTYHRVSSGTCLSNGYNVIYSQSECLAAAQSLGLSIRQWDPQQKPETHGYPPGCTYHVFGNLENYLRVTENTVPCDNTANRDCLCKVLLSTTTTTALATTTTTLATTTTTLATTTTTTTALGTTTTALATTTTRLATTTTRLATTTTTLATTTTTTTALATTTTTALATTTTRLATTTTTTTTTLARTTTTTATFASTTAATTTQAPYVFEGSFTINVTNATEFVQEPNLQEVLTDAIAQWAEVNVSYVHNVNISLAPTRRLSIVRYGLDDLLLSLRKRKLQSDFSMQTQSGVIVTFDIIIPPDGSEAEVIATIVVQRFEQKGLQEATELINTVIRSGALGNEYEAKVTTKVIRLTQEPTPVAEETLTPAKKDDSAASVMMVIGAACVGLLLILLAGSVQVYRKVLKKKHISGSRHKKLDDEFVEKSGSKGSLELYELLFPPPLIEESQRRALLQLVQVTIGDEAFLGDVEQASDLVVITYDIGQRVYDAPSAGPGLYYGAAVCRSFYEHGLQCYMFLPGAEDRTLELLTKSHTRCRLLVALETWDLYNSSKCLQEIYAAQCNGIEILRLRFDEDISEEQFAWPCVAKHDVAGMDMVNGLKEHYMLLQPQPCWSCVPLKPDTLQAIASDFSQKFMVSRSVEAVSSSCTSTTRRSGAIVGMPSLPESISSETFLRTASDTQRTASAGLAKQREELSLSLPMTKIKSSTKTKKVKSNSSPSPHLATIGRSDSTHTKSDRSKSAANSPNSTHRSNSGRNMPLDAKGSHSSNTHTSRIGQKLKDVEKTIADNVGWKSVGQTSATSAQTDADREQAAAIEIQRLYRGRKDREAVKKCQKDNTTTECSARLREGQRKKATTKIDSLSSTRSASEAHGQAMTKTKSTKSTKRGAQSADRKRANA